MFDGFGKIDNPEGLNELAKNLLAEGDRESLDKLAAENGFDGDWVEAYVSGELGDEFANWTDMAYNRLNVEFGALKKNYKGTLFADWLGYLQTEIENDEALRRAILSKNKSLSGAFGKLLEYSFGKAFTLDDEIVKAANVKASNVKFYMPDMGTARRILTGYYKEG